MTNLILITEIVEKLILLILLGLSVWSVSIMIGRRRAFASEGQVEDLKVFKQSLQDNNFAVVKNWSEKHQSFIAGAMHAALTAPMNPESVDRAVASFVKGERARLEKGLAVLATLGANAPFVGLFGTVLGIIRSFAYLGSQSGSTAVMSGVSQALFATAIGLFVAIPAVVAFNIYTSKMKNIIFTIESLRDLYISKVAGLGQPHGKS